MGSIQHHNCSQFRPSFWDNKEIWRFKFGNRNTTTQTQAMSCYTYGMITSKLVPLE